MKILALPMGMNGCTWYRVKQPLTVMTELDLADTGLLFEPADIEMFENNLAETLIEADVILWRQGHQHTLEKILKDVDCSKKVIVYDSDDNDFAFPVWQENYRYYGVDDVWYNGPDGDIPIWIDKDSDFGKTCPPTIVYDKKGNTDKLEKLREMISKSDLVVTTTDRLAEVYKPLNKNVKVIPNAIDFNVYKPLKVQHEDFRVGWAGGASHYEDFFDYAQTIKDFIMAHKDAKLVIAGDPPKTLFTDLPEDKIEIHPWVRAEAHAYRLATLHFDVAVIPLKKTEFSVCKSPIKYLEMSALKVPSIVSKETPYKEVVVNLNNGLTFSNKAELRRSLERLYEDKILRIAMAASAYETVKKNYNQAEWSKKYFDILKEELVKKEK